MANTVRFLGFGFWNILRLCVRLAENVFLDVIVPIGNYLNFIGLNSARGMWF